MGLNGFEPLTSPLSGVRSNQLSYRPTNRKHPNPQRTGTRGDQAKSLNKQARTTSAQRREHKRGARQGKL